MGLPDQVNPQALGAGAGRIGGVARHQHEPGRGIAQGFCLSGAAVRDLPLGEDRRDHQRGDAARLVPARLVNTAEKLFVHGPRNRARG